MGRNVSFLVEPGRNIEVCDRADRNKSRSVEPSRNIEFRGRADRNISRLVKLSPNPVVLDRSKRISLRRNIDVVVAPVETYLTLLNLVET